MAMFEQTPLDEVVGTLDNVHDPPTSRNRLHAEHTTAEDCMKCSTMPGAPTAVVKAKKTSSSAVSNPSKTASLSPSDSRQGGIRRDSRDDVGIAVRRSTSTLAGGTSGGDKGQSMMIGMRGGEGGDGAGHAAEPVKGLAAFGSQGSLATIATGAMSTREASPRPPEPYPRVCTYDGTQVAVAKRGAEGVAVTATARGSADGSGRPASRGSSPGDAQRPGVRPAAGRGSPAGVGGAGEDSALPTMIPMRYRTNLLAPGVGSRCDSWR